jgi:type II restriction enzyme
MMRRIRENTTPTLLLLEYSATWSVRNLTAIHHSFITPSVIQCRPPLSVTARRAGWVGCNILLGAIPPEARVPMIESGKAREPKQVRSEFRKPEKLAMRSVSERNWAGAVLSLIHQTFEQTFTVQEAYSMEKQLSSLYPGNNNVRAKIRQQLQVLRDAGMLLTESRGVYKVRGR